MSGKTNKKSRKKVILLSVTALFLVACITMGTMAWLTAQDSLTNTFTVGSFTKPNMDDDVTTPDPQPGVDEDAEPNKGLGGYMIEPSWDTRPDAEHKLVPGGSLYKDPYVGIGAGSEDAVVYVYVDNNFVNQSVYFTLNDGWEAVAGQTTAGPEADTYVGGLFKYSNTLVAEADEDVWTTNPVFTKVIVNEDADTEDLDVEEKTIGVSCFIHQAKNGEGADIDSDEIEKAAIAAFAPTP